MPKGDNAGRPAVLSPEILSYLTAAGSTGLLTSEIIDRLDSIKRGRRTERGAAGELLRMFQAETVERAFEYPTPGAREYRYWIKGLRPEVVR